MRRAYVIARTRDGLAGGPRTRSAMNANQRHASGRTRGARAARRGDQRWANPDTGETARFWTLGWESVHGDCAGCAGCATGCEDASGLTGEQYLARWRRRLRARGRT